MRLGLAKIDGAPVLLSLGGSDIVRPGDLPADPLAILNHPGLRKRAEAAIASAPVVAGKVKLLPPLFMKAGDVCEVEVEGIGKLVNPIVDEVTKR